MPLNCLEFSKEDRNDSYQQVENLGSSTFLFFLKYSENFHCITEGPEKAIIAVPSIYKNYRINCQQKCLGSQSFLQRASLRKVLQLWSKPSTLWCRHLPLCYLWFKPWDLSDRKVLLAPVIPFQKTKNSFKNICQELELNDFFFFYVQLRLKWLWM